MLGKSYLIYSHTSCTCIILISFYWYQVDRNKISHFCLWENLRNQGKCMICSPTLYWILYLQHLNYNLHCFIYIVLLHFPSEERLYLSHVARSQLLGREQLCCISHYCTAWTCHRYLLSICRYIRFCYQCPIQLVCVCPVIQ